MQYRIRITEEPTLAYILLLESLGELILLVVESNSEGVILLAPALWANIVLPILMVPFISVVRAIEKSIAPQTLVGRLNVSADDA